MKLADIGKKLIAGIFLVPIGVVFVGGFSALIFGSIGCLLGMIGLFTGLDPYNPGAITAEDFCSTSYWNMHTGGMPPMIAMQAVAVLLRWAMVGIAAVCTIPIAVVIGYIHFRLMKIVETKQVMFRIIGFIISSALSIYFARFLLAFVLDVDRFSIYLSIISYGLVTLIFSGIFYLMSSDEDLYRKTSKNRGAVGS